MNRALALITFVAPVAIALIASSASAQPSSGGGSSGGGKAVAREAYARGERALEREDYASATIEFLRADEASPSDIAKKSALEAVQRSGDPALAARVLNRTAAPRDETVLAVFRQVEQTFGPKLARIRIACQASACAASIEGTQVTEKEAIWVTAGRHIASTTVDGGPATERVVDAVAGKTETLTLTARPAPPVAPPPSAAVLPPERTDPPAPPSRSDDGLSPAWFWVSAGVTVVVAGVATWSTIDLLSKRSEFDDASCGSQGSASCRAIADDGKSADTRSAILWASTGVLAAATAATGLFLVKWPNRVGFAPAPGGAALSFAGSWR